MKKITVNTINGQSKIFSFKLEKIVIYIKGERNIIENVVAGFVLGQAYDGYDFILHPSFFS